MYIEFKFFFLFASWGSLFSRTCSFPFLCSWGGKSLNANLPKIFFLPNVTKLHPKRSQTNNKYQGNFQGKIIMPVVAGTGTWGFTTFRLILNVVNVRALEHLAADRGGRSALHITSAWEFGTGKQSGSKFTPQPRSQNFKGSLPSPGQGKWHWERESSPVSLPRCLPLCTLHLPSTQRREVQMYPDHYNWRALITKSHR